MDVDRPDWGRAAWTSRLRGRALALALWMSAGCCGAAAAADLRLEGSRLWVTGALDGSAVDAFRERLSHGGIRTVVFEDSFGGTADAAASYAAAIKESGVATEVHGQCLAACAFAFLAGKDHRFGRGLQVNALLIPVASRPPADDLRTRWRNEEPSRMLAEFFTGPAAPGSPPPEGLPVADAAATPLAPTGTLSSSGSPVVARERWQPDHGVLFTSTPTLFGRIYNAFYCDGSQGRDTTRCEALPDADPHKLGVLSP